MTEALTRTQGAEILVTPDDIQTLKNTICRDLTDSELKLFVGFCRSRNFHPLDKRIAPFKSSGKMTMVTTIDAKRTIAHRTGQYDGCDGPFYCGKDGTWKDVWLSAEPIVACKMIAYRKGCSRPFVGILYASEYKGGAVAGQMPKHMLAKATESLALSKAFPEDLGQLYTDDEIPAASASTARLTEPAAQPPAPSNGRLSLTEATQPPVKPEVLDAALGEVPITDEERAEIEAQEARAKRRADAVAGLSSVGISADDIQSLLGDNPTDDDFSKARKVYLERKKNGGQS